MDVSAVRRWWSRAVAVGAALILGGVGIAGSAAAAPLSQTDLSLTRTALSETRLPSGSVLNSVALKVSNRGPQPLTEPFAMKISVETEVTFVDGGDGSCRDTGIEDAVLASIGFDRHTYYCEFQPDFGRFGSSGLRTVGGELAIGMNFLSERDCAFMNFEGRPGSDRGCRFEAELVGVTDFFPTIRNPDLASDNNALNFYTEEGFCFPRPSCEG